MKIRIYMIAAISEASDKDHKDTIGLLANFKRDLENAFETHEASITIEVKQELS